MHPGDPLTIVGREQGGNDVRSRTPALERSDKSAALVNTTEMYQRTLEMYDSGATFHQPPATLGHSAPAPLMSAPKPRKLPDRPETHGTSGYWPWLFPVGVAAMFALWLRKQRNDIVPRPNPRRARLV